MNDIKQDAIVIGGVNYSDSSRVLWLVTPDFGRQSLLVKGARRAKSKFSGRLETFNMLEVLYRRSRSGTLHTLREADVKNQFRGLRHDLDAFMAASRAVNLIKDVVPEDQESPELFHLLEDFLCCTDETAGQESLPGLLLAGFEWRLMSLLGLEPQLVDCTHCGQRLERMEKYRFQPAGGGVVCAECAGEPGSGPDRLMLLAYPALRFIYRSGRKFPLLREELESLGPEELEQAARAAERYMAYHLGDKSAGGGRPRKPGTDKRKHRR